MRLSGLCGWVGEGDPQLLEPMLERIPHRGDQLVRAHLPGAALGYRCWRDRPGHAAQIVTAGELTVACAGELAPHVPCPAQALAERLAKPAPELDGLDGNFIAAAWDAGARRLRVVGDPFGLRSLYWVEHRGVLFFASEIKQLLALPGLPVELDPVAIHAYLSFSFVPGERTPIHGLRRLPPGHLCELHSGRWRTRPYLRLVETIDPALEPDEAASAAIDRLGRAAVEARLPTHERVGLYLSGGLDSSSIGCWLRELGLRPPAYTLDFGELSVEREQAELVARHLDLPLQRVDAGPDAVAPILRELVWRLDLPFGDGVTGPHYLLATAARRDGLTAVFNGEGGDQLWGGWNNKPMLSAELYAPSSDAGARAQAQMLTYHRFYGLEDELYAPAFAGALADARAQLELPDLPTDYAGLPDERLLPLVRELGNPEDQTFMARLRRADIALKGCDNIQPRAERIAGGLGLDVRSPLFSRALTEHAFTLPARHKVRGVTEKHALKRAMSARLPEDIVWRRKSGMCVPTSTWILGPLRELARELLGPRALAARGLFRPDYVQRLRGGRDHRNEIRPRRIGEKLWLLVMLELWLRTFIDGRGAPPEAP